MPQLDALVFAPLLSSLLLLTALLLPLVSELLLLAVLSFRSRRCLGNTTTTTASATMTLSYETAARSSSGEELLRWWRPLRSYRRALQQLLLPYDAVSATTLPQPAPASGAALWHSIFRVLATSDHKLIGSMYLVFGFFSALVGSIL